MSGVSRALAVARRQRQRYLEDLRAFVRFPSVSSQQRHAADVRRCAEWLAERLRRAGLQQAAVVPTAGHPLVFGEWRGAAGRPTLLIYGHYDVQPADPLSAWHSPPFEPTVRDDNLYGRGASDDKGPILAHIAAIEAWLRAAGALPVNVLCLFEGEEEIGSPHLPAFLRRNHRRLHADAAIISDTRFAAPGRPALIYGLRGGLSFEIEVRGPPHDLHSGAFGGAVYNPLQALCEIISGLHASDGRIAIAGLYDQVRVPSAAERRALRAAGPGDERLLRDAGIAQGWGEPGYSLFERTTLRPALTINGISGGYQGSGGKSIIPARASAKLNLRLVPNQDPREIALLVRRAIARLAPPAVQVVVTFQHRSRPVLIDRRHPALRAAAIAYRRAFGSPPVFLRSGGSIPIVDSFVRLLGVPAVLMGFALPDDRMHAPNEKFHLPQFYRAIDACIWLLHETGAMAAGRTPQPLVHRAPSAVEG